MRARRKEASFSLEAATRPARRTAPSTLLPNPPKRSWGVRLHPVRHMAIECFPQSVLDVSQAFLYRVQGLFLL